MDEPFADCTRVFITSMGVTNAQTACQWSTHKSGCHTSKVTSRKETSNAARAVLGSNCLN